jgi:hypothetical protein
LYKFLRISTTHTTIPLHAFLAYRFHFNGGEAINEVYGNANYVDLGERGVDTRLGILNWTIDPRFKEYPWQSPYAYYMNSPIAQKDFNGEGAGDYYNESGEYLGNDGIDDNRVYTVTGDVKPSINNTPLVLLVSDIKYEGTVTSVKLEFNGQANANNSARADGTLEVKQVLDNGKVFTRFRVEAVGGPYGNGAPPNGDYTVDNPRIRSEAGYKRDGFGFSFNLNPQFETQRTDLRLHPDGNNTGTLGCIGLQSSGDVNKQIYNTLRTAINNFGALDLSINITGNPNNQGGGTVPNINE